jgi:hypothetical protein
MFYCNARPGTRLLSGVRMETEAVTPADIPCEVLPRSDASAAQLRALGQALADWSANEFAAEGQLRFIDNLVVAELLGGEDPTELVFAVIHADSDEDSLTITRRVGWPERPAGSAQKLTVSCSFRGAGYDRRGVIAALRGAIPTELVCDILIDGRSWNEA